jgi:hypothetical protein
MEDLGMYEDVVLWQWNRMDLDKCILMLVTSSGSEAC